MKRILYVLCLLAFAAPLSADTFKKFDSSETFTGFTTTKQAAGKSLVFREDQNKFIPIDLAEYEIDFDAKGRRNSVMVVSLNQPEVLLSEVVSQSVSDSIQKAADTGTRLIVVQIDSPGGNGAYMKNVAQTITMVRERTGCPVAAYISGGEYGGAYSAAAVVALACDRIYIAPNAAIGAVGHLTSAAMTNEEYIDYITTFNPGSLATYSVYAASLALAQNRPSVLAKALIDKQVTAVEVRDLTGRLSVAEQSQRTNDQTIVRVICEGLSQPLASIEPANAMQGFSKLLNLTAEEAVRMNMADKVVSSYTDILSDMNLAEVQTVRAPGAEDAIQKFNAARRSLNQLLTGIQQNENRLAVLQDQASKIEEIARTGVRVRERNEANYPLNGNNRGYENNAYEPYQPYQRNPRLASGNTTVRRRGEVVRYDDRDPYRGQTVITQEPSGNILQIQYEMAQLLNETIPMYRRAIGIGRRWPGALPSGISQQTLEQAMTSSQTLLTNVRRYINTLQYPQ